MSFRTKLMALNCIPLVIFAAISLMLGITQFRSSLYNETEGNLRSAALAALTLYSSQGYGDYDLQEDGNVWRGMNMNVSERTSIVDDLKRQTGVDITFYFGDRVAMTSITDKDGKRYIGTVANESIKTYILEQGNQLWCRSIEINGKPSQAYIIPVRQESDDSVAGALMASQSADGFNSIIRQYIVTTILVTFFVLLVVVFFIRRHVDWFAQKFSEVNDKSRQDLLTGLCNKITFETDVKEYLAKRKKGTIAILLIFDFDNFKHVNDHFGHQTGDEVLKAFANVLVRSFRGCDFIGRVGGDEFMTLMVDMDEDTLVRADEIAEEVLHALRELKVGSAGPFSCSIGIGTDGTGYGFQELYELADSALYEAKERGKACYVRYASEERPQGRTAEADDAI